MRKADYDMYADYIEPQPKDVEGLRELEELWLNQNAVVVHANGLRSYNITTC